MLSENLRKIMGKDLAKLRLEISTYKKEENIWKTDKNIANSAGNLCLHLVGNLNNYLGAVLGKTGYVRHRDREFSDKNVPRQDLLKMIDDTIIVVDRVLASIQPAAMEEMYPEKVLDVETTTGYFLTHLAVHLGYHLGQINYHRRLLD